MKKKRTPYKLIYICIFLTAIILIGVLAFAVYKLNTEFIPQQKEAKRYDELRDVLYQAEETVAQEDGTPSSDAAPDAETTSKGEVIRTYSLEELFKMNSDMVAWLTVPDTKIDYPVMHTPDDYEYYLHTDFDGYYSFSGCLFVGENCSIDSDVFVIYGHNMNNGSMFGEIDMYSYSDYMDEHRDVILRTRDGNRLYRVFASFPTKKFDDDDNSGEFQYYNSVGKKSKTEYEKIVEDICDLSVVSVDNKPQYPAQIAFLSTCAYHEENGRFVVAAYRIR